MSGLTAYDFDGQQIRTVMIDNEPWFVLADLCAALNLSSTHKVAERVSGDARSLAPVIDSMGRTQQATVVSEAGMYEVVIRSDSPWAVPFRRWVTHSVLPQIRRTGSYGQTDVAQISRSDLARWVIEAEQRAEVAEERVAYLEPRAEVADRILDATGDLSVADAAKSLARSGVEIGAKRLFDRLAQLGWTYRGGDGRWHIKQAALETGRLAALPQSHFHPGTGETVIDAPQVRVTPKGLTYLLQTLTGDQPRRLEVV